MICQDRISWICKGKRTCLGSFFNVAISTAYAEPIMNMQCPVGAAKART